MQATLWQALSNSWPALLSGATITVWTALAAITIGTVVGVMGGLILVYGVAPARWLVAAYVHIMRGIPVLVQILFWYYGLALFKINISPMAAGILALSAFCVSHVCETVRGVIQAVPQGQTEAAKAIGLRFHQRLLYVILPQALRRIVPPWINTAVEMVKGTVLLSQIGVIEAFLATQQTVARNYHLTLQLYLLLILTYLVVNFTISQLGALLERRFAYLKY